MGKKWKNLIEKIKMLKKITLETNFKKEYWTFAVTSNYINWKKLYPLLNGLYWML